MRATNKNRTYLDSKKFIMNLIARAKVQWQLSVIESMIETIFLKKVWNETENHWIVSSHCDDLQKACLIKRCELICN